MRALRQQATPCEGKNCVLYHKQTNTQSVVTTEEEKLRVMCAYHNQMDRIHYGQDNIILLILSCTVKYHKLSRHILHKRNATLAMSDISCTW